MPFLPPSGVRLCRASWKCQAVGSRGLWGWMVAVGFESQKISPPGTGNHWFIAIDQQSYQLPQIYDGGFVQRGTERIISLIALSFWVVFIRTCAQVGSRAKRWERLQRLTLFPWQWKYWTCAVVAQLWLSQWKIDEAPQVDTKLSVLFINVLWLDPLAALCKLIAV